MTYKIGDRVYCYNGKNNGTQTNFRIDEGIYTVVGVAENKYFELKINRYYENGNYPSHFDTWFTKHVLPINDLTRILYAIEEEE